MVHALCCSPSAPTGTTLIRSSDAYGPPARHERPPGRNSRLALNRLIEFVGIHKLFCKTYKTPAIFIFRIHKIFYSLRPRRVLCPAASKGPCAAGHRALEAAGSRPSPHDVTSLRVTGTGPNHRIALTGRVGLASRSSRRTVCRVAAAAGERRVLTRADSPPEAQEGRGAGMRRLSCGTEPPAGAAEGACVTRCAGAAAGAARCVGISEASARPGPRRPASAPRGIAPLRRTRDAGVFAARAIGAGHRRGPMFLIRSALSPRGVSDTAGRVSRHSQAPQPGIRRVARGQPPQRLPRLLQPCHALSPHTRAAPLDAAASPGRAACPPPRTRSRHGA